MLRVLDIAFSFLGLILSAPLLAIIYVIGVFDTGAPVFRQVRVGYEKQPFVLIKFRTMKRSAPCVASHLADISQITLIGSFLRRTKLDELPQLWNVLVGEMSIVGPRPCLFNQVELIKEREQLGVFKARPGITGMAQVNNVDMSTPKLLSEMDAVMLKTLNVRTYFKYIIMTVCGKGVGDGVRK